MTQKFHPNVTPSVETLSPVEKEPAEPRGDLSDLASLFRGPLGVRSIALTGLFVLACFYTLYFAREFLLPVVIALLLNFLLAPLVRGLSNVHVPTPAGAAVLLITVLGFLGLIVYELSAPLAEWVNRVPAIAEKVSTEFARFRKPVDRVTKATEQMEKITASPSDGQRPAQKVEIKGPGMTEFVVTQTRAIIFAILELLVLLYFLLASGDLFLKKMIHVLPRFEDKKRAVQIAREIEDTISSYLGTVALINGGLGTAGALAFWALGLPTPYLWGAMAALLNFIPYVGAVATIGIVTVVSVATFPSLPHALLAPGAYLILASLEGSFITPLVLGHRLTLNPVVIFIGVAFWSWIWGIPGALLAVPLLVALKIFCDHITPLGAIGEFLGS